MVAENENKIIARQLTLFRNAFPDLHVTTEDIFSEGEKVVSRWTALPPSGYPQGLG